MYALFERYRTSVAGPYHYASNHVRRGIQVKVGRVAATSRPALNTFLGKGVRHD
jgi:hypothetical protein